MAIERWALGRVDEALALARRAREGDPLTADLRMVEADYLVHAGEHDAAIALYQRSIHMDPGNLNPYFGLAEALFHQGRFDEAIETRRQAHRIAGDRALEDVIATAQGEEGYRRIDRAWVQLQLDTYKERALTDYVSPLDFARVYAQLGDRDEAFRHLDAAFADRSPGLVYLKADRAWDAVRDDPRFQAAVQRVGLP